MFNSTSLYGGDVNISKTVKINACSGGIYKTYKESWFERFNLQSELAEELLNNCAVSNVRSGKFYNQHNSWHEDTVFPDYKKPKYEKKELIILQMVICGDMEVIAEIIKKEDFDKYFVELEVVKTDENN